MHIPAYYRNNELSEIKSLIRKKSFATLVALGSDKPEATRIPIELVEEEMRKLKIEN